MKPRFLLLTLCLGFGLTACVGQDKPTPVRDTQTQASANAEQTALEGTRWVLRTLGGQPVQVYPNQPEANVVFATDTGEGRISGSDGCNLLVGSYTAGAATLELQHIGTTMMLCPQGADQSRAFMKALGATNTWTRNGTKLELHNGDTVLAVFEGTAL